MYQGQGKQQQNVAKGNYPPSTQGQGHGQGPGHQNQGHQGQGHNPGRPFLRNPQVNMNPHNLLNKGKGPGKGPYRSNSTSCWTPQHPNPLQNQHQHHPQHPSQGHGGGSNMGVLNGRNPTPGPGLGRSYSMSSFHPPLCAYTPSPGLGFGAWAKGPPAGLSNGPGRGGPTMVPNYPPPPHHGSGGGGSGFPVPVPQHHNYPHGGHGPGHHIGFSSQFPFYYNAVPSGHGGHGRGGHSSPITGPGVKIGQPGNSSVGPPGPIASPSRIPPAAKAPIPPVPVTSSSSATSSGETSSSLSTSTSASSSSRPGSSGSGSSSSAQEESSSSLLGNGKSDATVTATSSSSSLEVATGTPTSTSGATSNYTSSSEKESTVKPKSTPAEAPKKEKFVPTPPVFRMPTATDLSITHNLCALCCKKNARLCSGCRHVAYCSEKCQVLNWSKHMWKCNPPVIIDPILAIETMRRQKEKEKLDNFKPKETESAATSTEQGSSGDKKVSDLDKVANVEIKQAEVDKSVILKKVLTPRNQQRYNSFVRVMDLSGLSQEKLEFRSKIAELSAVLADSLGVPTAAKLYEDESQSHAWSLEQGDTEYLNGPDNSKLKPEPESSPSESVHQPDNDADAETAPKVGYTGKMLTRKEIPPCGLVACIPPIMITCYNTMLTPPPPDSVICLNCTRWYQSSLGYRCTSCRWPVCTMECEKSYLHTNFECKVFAASKRLPPSLKEHNQFFNDAILIIRCLLLKFVNISKYNELADLMEFCDPTLPGPHEKVEAALKLDKRTLNYLKNECDIANWTDFNDQELLTFINVIDACSMVVQDRIFIQVQDSGKSYYAPKFVFPIKMYVNQECIPNSKWSIKHSSKFEDCSMRIHATSPLAPQTYVTTCFNSDKHVIGSWFQLDLSVSKFKNRCRCTRCRDPTESGSFFSAVTCMDCNPKNDDSSPGYLLPKEPLNRESEWVCQNPDCDKVMEGSKMRAKILGMHDEIHNINTHEDFYALIHLKWRLEVELHKNHFLLLKISVICVMLFWGCVRGLPFFSPRYDFFISTINLAQEALRIYDFVCPGMSIQRARVLFQLQVAYAYKHLRDIRRYMEWGGDTMSAINKQSPTPGHPISFWELMKIQQEAHSILKTEPYGTMENEMAVVLQEVIEDQKDLLSNCLKEVNLEMTAVYNLHKIYTRFSNQYYYPAVPIYEDKDIQEFEVMTGPCARHLLDKMEHETWDWD